MLVSVITPTLNSAAWIAACVDSVVNQQTDEVKVEHVVADGGSTDDTVAIARDLGARLVDRDPTDSLAVVINKATFASSGDLVGFLGSDDVLLPGALAAIARRYLSSGRRWVTGSYVWTDADLHPVGRIAAPPSWMGPRALACLDWALVNAQSTYFERSFFEELGGYDPAFPTSLDYELFLRAQRLAPYARETRPIALYRRHGSNMSIVSTGAAEENRRLLEEYGPSSDLARRAYRMGMKAFVNARNPRWSLGKRKLGHTR